MERKIGEIFEHKGEWYQCVEASYDKHSCFGCDGCWIEGGSCNAHDREDDKYVIFKKLEKVGKPHWFEKRIMQTYNLFTEAIPPLGIECFFIWHLGLTIELEIKQNQEDMGDNDDIRPYDELFSPGTVSNTKYLAKEGMEEKKFCEEISKANEVNMIFKIASKYINGGITYDEFGKAMRNWINGSEKDEHILKEFDLEAAKVGKPVCTRDGRSARIVCFDSNGGRPIVALVTECDDEEEIPYKYHCDGSYNCQSIPSDNDLMMFPEKKEGWINIYNNEYNHKVGARIYNSKKEALNDKASNAIDTVKIEWEE